MNAAPARSPAASTGIVPIWMRNIWGAQVGVVTVYAVALAAWTVFHWGGEANATAIGDLGTLPVSLFAALAALRAAAASGRPLPARRAWLFLGLAVFTQFIADSIWAYLEVVKGLPMDELFPSVADYFYLSFYPLMLIGLLSFPVAPLKAADRLRFAIDLIIVMVAAWMVVWFFIIVPTTAEAESDVLASLIAAAYPIGDLVVIGGIVALILREPPDAVRSALMLMLAGLAFFVSADLIYAFTSLNGTYVSGGWVDNGWTFAYLLFGYAAVRQAYLTPGPGTRVSAQLMARVTTVLPFVAIALGYGLALAIIGLGLATGAGLLGLIVGAAVLTLAIVGRQVVTLRENLRLTSELQTFSLELERRVEDRTRQLQQSQDALLASQKLASIGTLAAGVVHEVSNPLNTIITAAESLESQAAASKVDPASLKVYLPIITRAAWHATRIVQALRTYSRGSSPELAVQNLGQVVQDALLLMGYQLKQWGNVKLVTELDPDLPDVICDRNQMAQVLINLLNNARDAMPEGGTITLRSHGGAPGAVIEVSDEGIGLAPEIADKIFDPFFTTKPIGEGSGLGLSIVAGIIRAHNGAVAARSDGPGKGATFTITLPVAPVK